jgi:hypothetical protein
VLKKNIRSGAKGCKNDKTKNKNTKKKMEKKWRRGEKERVRQNGSATRIR